MCDCIQFQENLIKEQLPLKNEDYQGKQLEEVYFKNKFISFTNSKEYLYTPVVIKYKDYTKKGEEILKQKIVNFTLAYCPFCGEKIEY